MSEENRPLTASSDSEEEKPIKKSRGPGRPRKGVGKKKARYISHRQKKVKSGYGGRPNRLVKVKKFYY